MICVSFQGKYNLKILKKKGYIYIFDESGPRLFPGCSWFLCPLLPLSSSLPVLKPQFLLGHPGLGEGEQGMIWRVGSHVLQERASE